MKAPETELEALAHQLRARVAERRYREAQEALLEYCKALRKTVAGLPRGDPCSHRLEDEWRRLAEQTRRGVLAGRAHAAARLARLAQTLPGSRLYEGGREARRTREWLA